VEEPICVVKIGGSACTKKAEFETLEQERLGKTCAQIAEAMGIGQD